MTTMAGATFLAWSNRSRTRLAPTPTIASMNSDAETVSGGLAFTGTPAPCNCWNRLSSANVGRSVVKRVTCSPGPPPGGGA
jgi:hypothetical protein